MAWVQCLLVLDSRRSTECAVIIARPLQSACSSRFDSADLCIECMQVQYLHPKDGVYPEKVNAGRQAVNANQGSIGKNPNPVQIKFSGKLVSSLQSLATRFNPVH